MVDKTIGHGSADQPFAVQTESRTLPRFQIRQRSTWKRRRLRHRRRLHPLPESRGVNVCDRASSRSRKCWPETGTLVTHACPRQVMSTKVIATPFAAWQKAVAIHHLPGRFQLPGMTAPVNGNVVLSKRLAAKLAKTRKMTEHPQLNQLAFFYTMMHRQRIRIQWPIPLGKSLQR